MSAVRRLPIRRLSSLPASLPEGMGIRSGRRGQTLVLALSILFLLVLLGGIFVSMILRNLTRVSRQHQTDDALTLALAGVKYAADQLKNSPDGADWRPTPTEALWREPQIGRMRKTPPDPLEQLRKLDPDGEWLSDSGRYERPFVRFHTGRGRFLLRVTYRPSFVPQSAASEIVDRMDLFDRNSGLIHIESVGRPGEFDPDDPTLYEKDAANNAVRAKRGLQRKVEAFVPVGLLDQLWWITNQTNERGPATLGVPAFRDGNGRYVEFPSLFAGAIRSNVDLQVQGRNVVRVYPARGEGLFVKGKLQLASRANAAGGFQLRIDAMDDTSDGAMGVLAGDDHNDDPSDDTLIQRVELNGPVPILNTGSVQTTGNEVLHTVMDETNWPGSDPLLGNRGARLQAAPVLDYADRATGLNRWRRLTKYSGGNLTVANAVGGNVNVNAGMYALTDVVLPPSIRARGLYIDNFDDIQYPKNRQKVRDEWLRREPTGLGWAMDRYTPTVKGGPDDHPYRQTATPVVDVFLTSVNGQPKIRVERWDPDVRLLNVPATAPTALRQFYDLNVDSATPTGGAGSLVPAPFDNGRVKYFDPPENGVIFAEGSIRIRGKWGTGSAEPRPLTVVSGGTIYIEGNLLQERGNARPHESASGWQIALLAQDYVTLNPTALVRLYPGNDVFQSADPNTGERFLQMPPGSVLDFTFTTAEPLTSAFLQLRHSGKYQDNYSQTRVTLFQPRASAGTWPDWTTDRYDFAAHHPGTWTPPWPPPDGSYANTSQLFYWFYQLPQQPGVPTLSWGESNYQSVGPPFAWEQKTFLLPRITSDGAPVPAGAEVRFRLATGQELNSNEQDYLLSRVALIPTDRPLPIRVEAVMYAYTGSWFVIPPPFMNRLPDDTRKNFLSTGIRHTLDGQPVGTFPENTDTYPFYNEALNVDIHVVGAITENMPAEPTEKAIWTNHTWVMPPDFQFDHTAVLGLEPDMGNRPPFSPLIRYSYDHNLRRMIRVKYTRPFTTGNGVLRNEEVVWLSGPGKPATMRTLGQAFSEAVANESYLVTLPLVPRLPVGPVIYEGNPL